jgi:phosphoenolpyruvate carboxykinase (ATP)
VIVNARIHANRPAAALVQAAVERGEGVLTTSGAFAALTGERTGRSPKDKFTVQETGLAEQVDWTINQPMEPAVFDRLRDRVLAYLQNRELFTFDGFAGADPAYEIPVRVIAERAWHALFARCLFRRTGFATANGWTVLHACDYRCEPVSDGVKSPVCVALSYSQRLVMILGTQYAGEIKKSIFTVLNGLLPQAGVLPMHCSANIGAAGDTALFFGLSGTGKTTLSADPHRRLIGDDEHGWGADGVFNFEGGCYAKTIRLSASCEPQIWNALRFGCVLENVPVDPDTHVPDFNSQKYTENTRGAYPIDFIPNCEPTGRGGHPKNIFFLTYDAFGVLPPLARLTPEQAMQQFLLGYTAKVAGTETGVTEPTPEFSTCFARPFLPLSPKRYGEMLREKLQTHRVPVWLVNTGLNGSGSRIKLAHTRALLTAVLDGSLTNVPFAPEQVFGFDIPTYCPDVPAEILSARTSWRDSTAYESAATKLATLFREKAAAL